MDQMQSADDDSVLNKSDKPELDASAEHTLAKHDILRHYMAGWLPILGRGQSNRLLYFDGFAGSGKLSQGHDGSPVAVIRTAMSAHGGKVPLEIRMVEKDLRRHKYLSELIDIDFRHHNSLDNSNINIIPPLLGDCESAVLDLIKGCKNSRKALGPAFFFLDQYGYSNVSMDLITRIMQEESCEAFVYLNWERMHPYFTDATKAESLTSAIGGEEWRTLISGGEVLKGKKRVDAFKSIYINALKSRAKVKYVYDFAMKRRDGRLIYWLFFCTNKLRGLEVMKKAMWAVDPSGRFEFSDADVGQESMFPYTQDTLAKDLDESMGNRSLTTEELREHVLTRTPEYRYAEAISKLKAKGRVEQKNGVDGKVIYRFIQPEGNLFGGF